MCPTSQTHISVALIKLKPHFKLSITSKRARNEITIDTVLYISAMVAWIKMEHSSVLLSSPRQEDLNMHRSRIMKSWKTTLKVMNPLTATWKINMWFGQLMWLLALKGLRPSNQHSLALAGHQHVKGSYWLSTSVSYKAYTYVCQIKQKWSKMRNSQY